MRNLKDERPWQSCRGYGLFVWLRSDDKKKYLEESWRIGHDYSAKQIVLNDKMAIANLRDRARLLDFLGEFYSRRSTPIYVRLIVSDLAWFQSTEKPR